MQSEWKLLLLGLHGVPPATIWPGLNTLTVVLKNQLKPHNMNPIMKPVEYQCIEYLYN